MKMAFTPALFSFCLLSLATPSWGEKSKEPPSVPQIENLSALSPRSIDPLFGIDPISRAAHPFLYQNLSEDSGIAESWKGSQTTTFFYDTKSAARAAHKALKKQEWEHWGKWEIEEIIVLGTMLRINFTKIRAENNHEISQILLADEKTTPLPLQRIRIETAEPNARELYEVFINDCVEGQGICHVWHESPWNLEILSVGDAQYLIRELKHFFDDHEESAGMSSGSVNLSKKNLPCLSRCLWEITLKRDLTWADQSPVHAKEIKDCLLEQRDKKGTDLAYREIEEIEVVDKRTLLLALRRLYQPAQASLSSKPIYKNTHPKATAPSAPAIPIGTGQYLLDAKKSKQELIRLIGGRDDAALPTRSWGTSYDSFARYLKLFSKQPATYIALTSEAPLLKKVSSHHLQQEATGTELHLIWNHRAPWKLSKAQRRYLNQLWKKQTLPQSKTNKIVFDQPLTLLVQKGNSNRQQLLRSLSKNWKEKGVKLDIVEKPWNELLAQLQNGENYHGILIGWGKNAGGDRSTLWHSAYEPPRGANYGAYKNDTVDELLEALQESYDSEHKNSLQSSLEKALEQDPPSLILGEEFQPILRPKSESQQEISQR